MDALQDLGRHECVETAELGVSELVTNAVLHAAPPISVKVRGTRQHPRVEVRDGSTEPPALPERPELDLGIGDSEVDEEALLVTFGRGLDIVARCSDAWGAEIEEDGKVVWFTPATAAHGEGVRGTITGISDEVDAGPGPTSRPYELLGAPVDHVSDFERHYRELRREVRLLSLAHEADYPVAKNLSDLFGSLQRELHLAIDEAQVRQARRDDLETMDLSVSLTDGTARQMGGFVELLDFADQFCREQRMLSLARTPEQRSFQTWFLTEIVRQQAGQAPLPYATMPQLRAQA